MPNIDSFWSKLFLWPGRPWHYKPLFYICFIYLAAKIFFISIFPLTARCALPLFWKIILKSLLLIHLLFLSSSQYSFVRNSVMLPIIINIPLIPTKNNIPRRETTWAAQNQYPYPRHLSFCQKTSVKTTGETLWHIYGYLDLFDSPYEGYSEASGTIQPLRRWRFFCTQ